MTTRHEPDRLLMTCPWPVLAADDRAAYDDGPTSTSPFDAAVGRHVDALADLLGDRDAVAELSTAQLRDHVQVLRRLEGLTTASLAATVHLLHRRGGTREDGASSPTDWIRARTGRSGREAHRLARLGANLDDLPGTAAALSRGDVSAESADAIVQATGNGLLGDAREVEDQLLDDARTQSPEQLRASIRRREHQADGAALLRDERRQHANRRFAMQGQRDGMWRVNGHLQWRTGRPRAHRAGRLRPRRPQG